MESVPPIPIDGLAVMEKPVKEGGSNHGITKEFLPVAKLLFGGIMVELFSASRGMHRGGSLLNDHYWFPIGFGFTWM